MGSCVRSCRLVCFSAIVDPWCEIKVLQPALLPSPASWSTYKCPSVPHFVDNPQIARQFQTSILSHTLPCVMKSPPRDYLLTS